MKKMSRAQWLFCLITIAAVAATAFGAEKNEPVKPIRDGGKALIVMDEREQMEVLAKFMKDRAGVESTIVNEKNLPEDLTPYRAVIAYIHGAMSEKTEVAIIDYTKKGGRLICLHHQISTGKAKNKYFFDFLGVRLDGGDESRNPSKPGGHYAWVDPIDMTLVNLAPSHFITSHDVVWDKKVSYASSDEPTVELECPAVELDHAEAYMNHKFTDGREKTVLVGFKFLDERNGELYMQDRAVWIKPQGKGHVLYYKPGHAKNDFEKAAVSQMILNGILWTP